MRGPMSDALLESMRVLNIAGYLLIIVLATVYAMSNRGRWLYAVPVALLGINGLIFYLVLEFYFERLLNIEVIFINSWSTALRLQSVLTVIILALAMILGMSDTKITIEDHNGYD